MQKFLEKRDIIPHSLASFERPNPENFLQRVSRNTPFAEQYNILPDGKIHGEYWSKKDDTLGFVDERSIYKFGLLNGKYCSTKVNVFLGSEATRGFFKEDKPHGEFVFGTARSLYEDGKLLRHECEARCPYLCSRRETVVMQWEHQGEDLVVSQKTKQGKDWDTIVRYKSIYFDEKRWMLLPYGKIGVFSSPVPNILSKRVYAKSCIFEKGEGRSFEGPLVVPYFLY
ncbi:hypothetical protein [Kurlavirus BKC-1]|nr:hypothetical protein [Kurlavirus BKC-1]